MSDRFEFTRWPEAVAETYRAKGYWRGETMGGMLKRLARMQPDRMAVSDASSRLTYAQLDAQADRVANGFQSLGVAAGNRVVVQLPNSVRFLETLFGLFRLGALPVLALLSDRLSEITHVIQTSGAKAYVIQDQAQGFNYRQIAEEVSGLAPTLRHVIVAGEHGRFTPFECLYGERVALPDRRPGDPVLIMLSGGSTALPKLIVRTHDDYLYSFTASAEICQLDANSVYLCALPAGHNFALSSPGILGVLSAGGHVVMTTDPSSSAAFALIEQEKVTFTALVPGLALAWLYTPCERRPDSLRFIQIGGAKLSAEVAERIMSTFGCALQQVFGMTEGLVCYTRLGDDIERVMNTQGLPISEDDEIRIVDENGRDVPAGQGGQLIVRGPYTIRSYLNAPEHNARAFTDDGYYKTGDIVSRRPDGYLVVEGRLKDQVNRGGEKISSEEVEGHLLAHPGVREAAIVAVQDEFLGEASCAFVVHHKAHAMKASEIKAFMAGRGVAPFKIPDQIRFVPSLPKTPVGKIDKKELRKQIPESRD